MCQRQYRPADAAAASNMGAGAGQLGGAQGIKKKNGGGYSLACPSQPPAQQSLGLGGANEWVASFRGVHGVAGMLLELHLTRNAPQQPSVKLALRAICFQVLLPSTFTYCR